jgi:NAD+ kinase
MPTNALLLYNPNKPDAMNAAGEIRALIQRHGTLAGELPAPQSAPVFSNGHPVLGPELEKFRGVNLIVVLGGDGTLLAQTRRCIGLNAPMLGVNFGRLGFMAEFDVPALAAQAEAIFGRSEFATSELTLIRAEIHAHGASATPRFTGLALNDAVVTAGPPFRMISLSLSVDGQEGPEIHGDGLVVSTPVGSTAYNLSAGGPILVPGVDAHAIAPIAAHSLSFRPIVVPASSRIEIIADRANALDSTVVADRGTTLVLDGQVHEPVRTGDHIVLERHSQRVRFVTNRYAGYWSRLLGKLEWAKSPRPPV